MTYKCVMVRLELNKDNTGLLKIAADLAEPFAASVIGIAACQPIRPFPDAGLGAVEIYREDEKQNRIDLAAAEAEFRAALGKRIRNLEWRSTITYGSLAEFISVQARAADLILTGPDIDGPMTDSTRRVNIGDLVMWAGKPVLIVPKGASSLSLSHVFVGWNDSREARRAVHDALPLLEKALKATVLEVTPDEDVKHAEARTKDVAAWLARHGISALPAAISAPGMEMPGFHKALRDGRCDLLIAGAYGHSRVGEWVFGGVTKDILLDPDYCVLVSH